MIIYSSNFVCSMTIGSRNLTFRTKTASRIVHLADKWCGMMTLKGTFRKLGDVIKTFSKIIIIKLLSDYSEHSFRFSGSFRVELCKLRLKNFYEDICIRVVNSASLIFGNLSKVCEANSCQVDKRWHLHPCCFIPLSSLP